MQKHLQNLAKQIGINTTVTFQVLRRSFATRHRNDLKDAGAVLGHTHYATTTANVYAQSVADEVRAMASQETERPRTYAVLFYNDINSGQTSVIRYRTIDNSLSWQQLAATPGTPELRSWHVLLGVDQRDAKHVIANDAYSLYESHDSGQTWKRADVANNKNIGDDWVNIAFDHNNKAVVTADRNVYHYDPAH